MVKMQFDVIVVGAGPSGSITSYYLSKAGFDTLLIEKHKLSRYKPCGGNLSRRVIEELPFNVKKIVEKKVRKVEFISPMKKERAEVKYNKPIGYTIDREHFDSFVTYKAVDEGTTLKDGCTVKDIVIKKEFVEVKTTCGEFKAKFLVGADGVNSVVARKTKIRKHWKPEQMATLMVAHLESNDFEEDKAKFYFGPNNYFKVGYGWVFPLTGGLNVGLGAATLEARNLKNKFSKFLEHENFGKLKIKRYHGATLPLNNFYLPHPYNKKVVLVGDSAGYINLISGEGIYHALISGKIAAEKIIKLLESEKEDGTDYFQEYSKECFDLFGNEMNSFASKMQKQLYSDEKTQNLLVKMMRTDEKLAKYIVELIYALSDFKETAKKINRRKYLSFIKSIFN